MILDRPSLDALAGFAADVCVIGAGPVGIVLALGLAARGRRVVVLESGGRGRDAAARALAAAENATPAAHFPPETVIARRLGGASNLWGGRCLPFDEVDFAARPWLGLEPWPVEPAALAPYLAEAVAGLGAGAAEFAAPVPGFAAGPEFGVGMLERWSSRHRIQRLHARALARHDRVLIALHATALGFGYEGGRIASIELAIEGQGRGALPAGTVVLAAGGIDSTRLLLAEQRRRPALFGGPEGPLGRFYMGHLTGEIADVVFEDARLHDAMDFHVDAHGGYVRRRIVPSPATQAAERLANIAFWPVVPRIADARHRSGPLSAVYLGLSLPVLGPRLISEAIRLKHLGPPPYRRGPHLGNVLRDLPRTLGFVPQLLWRTKLAPARLPGFFLTNPGRRYRLEYHGEHLPDPESRITLTETADRLGLPRARVALRFAEADAWSVVRAHDALASWLGRSRLGRLEHDHAAPEDRARAVLAAARDGTHQAGTIRMGRDARSGVVDAACRAFDVPNLYVAGTAVLPSSSQANPTLTAVQLALRLADRLAAR